MRHTLLALALLAGCTNDPFAPIGDVERFTPPAIYASWYATTAQCVGVPGDFAAIEWWLVDSIGGLPHQGEVVGTWTAPHTIRIMRGREADEAVVTHEMVHDLIQSPDHPAAYFPRCMTDPAAHP
jgi:hypothetical protein